VLAYEEAKAGALTGVPASAAGPSPEHASAVGGSTLAEPQGLHQIMLGLPSRVSLPTAEASLEVAASRALEAPLLAPQLQQTGTGTQWLEDNSLGGGKAPPWIATMADDIALATSFWR
jgi:hypothetical protein